MIEHRPDWCISRQRAWGVPIVAFYCEDCGEVFLTREILAGIIDRVRRRGRDVWFANAGGRASASGDTLPACGGADVQKGDRHPGRLVRLRGELGRGPGSRPALACPADLYLEGTDQHRGWFHCSLLTAVGTRGHAPYKGVLTHGFVVDGEGQKMSKSLGNVIAPEEVMDKYGAEILRLWVAAEDYRDDMRLSDDILKRLAEAYRRIRNTARFMLGNLYDFDPQRHSGARRRSGWSWTGWPCPGWRNCWSGCNKAYEDYEFHLAYHRLHQFCAVEMSALYLDILKDRLYVSRAGFPGAAERPEHPLGAAPGSDSAYGSHSFLYRGRGVGLFGGS